MSEFTPPKPPLPPEPAFEVSAADFIKAVKGENIQNRSKLFKATGEELLRRKEFQEYSYRIGLDKDYVVLYSAKIQDADVLEFVNDELTDYNVGIILYKSVVPDVYLEKAKTKGWLLIHSHARYIYITDKSQSGDISIAGSSQSEVISINDKSKAGDIWIAGASQSGFISINRECQSGDISIAGASQSGDIWIAGASQSGDISINDKSKAGDISIDKSQCGNIRINRDSQCGDINIESNSLCESISLNNNSQCQDIIINKSQTGNIRIRESQCTTLVMDSNYAGMELYNASIPQMRITNSYLPAIYWQAGTKGELYISNSKINHLALNHTALLKDALFSVVDSSIYVSEMNKLAVQGQLLFTNTGPLDKPFKWEPLLKQQLPDSKPADDATDLNKDIYVARVSLLEEQEGEYNKGVEKLQSKFKRKGVNKPVWIIANSSMGKTEITGSELKGFRFEYRDSKILDMFIAGTKMPDGEIEIYEPPDAVEEYDDIDFFEQQVAVYSQLKKIFDNQGNIVQSTRYHAKAMEKQQRLLEEARKKDGKGWKSWVSDQGFDLFNFRLNKWSNNHGESWRKAFWFVFLTSLGVYILYYISLYYQEPFSFDATGRFIGHFFSFLNITRKEDFMPDGDKLNWWLSLALSFFGRIVTGFGIYQLIAAFRRHGRK
ncbi:MAG: hypothetical protein JNM88_13770 [Chitinophagaceae bacterium]|nr:hypothetical protein [Chitinophagaceae bacterium]